jgi:hypothetical protein
MSKLLQRLSDASKSGVYRAPHAQAILEATQGSTLQVSRIGLGGAAGKAALLERIAGALRFPRWFGGNWDALEDCLMDLSWSNAAGHVLRHPGRYPRLRRAGVGGAQAAVLRRVRGRSAKPARALQVPSMTAVA